MKNQNEFLFRVADIGFHARWSTPCSLFIHDPLYKEFLFLSDDIEGARSGLRHCTAIDFSHCADELMWPKGMEKILQMPGHWSLYKTDSKYYLERFYPPTGKRLSISLVTKDFKKVTYFPEKPISWDATYLFQPLLRYLLVNIIAQMHGLMLHGALVKIDDKAVAFVGSSGSGKTTLSKFFLKAGFKVLTDESIAIFNSDGKVWAYGTPWPGEGRVASAEKVPLAGIYFISHGIKNILRKVDIEDAIKKILEQVILHVWDEDLISRIIDSAKTLAANTPCFDMPFINDERVVEFVRKNIVKRRSV